MEGYEREMGGGRANNISECQWLKKIVQGGQEFTKRLQNAAILSLRILFLCISAIDIENTLEINHK